jgi:cytochrome c556
MKRILRKTVYFFTLLLIAGFPPEISSAHNEQPHHVHGSTQPAPASTNPLIEEMTALDAAFRDIVSAVALGDTERVHGAIESLHGTMEKTHEGMHAGTVTLPKNAARTKEFAERDAKFHEKLDALDRATRRKNQREMLRITKQLLDGCVQCHQTFKK